MNIGEVNNLQVLRFTSVGAYLGDEEDNDVLLPNKYLTDDMKIDDMLDVFVYRDSEDRAVATTEKPLIELGGFSYLFIKDVTVYGAFADWGLEKDLMIPFKEQNKKLEVGHWYLTTLQLDADTDRVYGSTKINRYLHHCDHPFDRTTPAELLICDTTELGVKVIVDNRYSGLIYHNDITRNLERGERTTGFVYNVREDGKLDVRLDPVGKVKISESAEKLLSMLKVQKYLPVHDKSAPEDVRATVGMSKKTFKQAVGSLYKERLITLESDGIRLVE
jgi:predicted RNA-binding protein (virulence factor B family)